MGPWYASHAQRICISAPKVRRVVWSLEFPWFWGSRKTVSLTATSEDEEVALNINALHPFFTKWAKWSCSRFQLVIILCQSIGIQIEAKRTSTLRVHASPFYHNRHQEILLFFFFFFEERDMVYCTNLVRRLDF